MGQRMLNPGLATIYAHWMIWLPRVAKQYGYALAVHGSLCTDLDLIAIPWREDPVDANTIASLIADEVGGTVKGPPTEKNHGRLAFTITIGSEDFIGPHIDLSVMPTKERK